MELTFFGCTFPDEFTAEESKAHSVFQSERWLWWQAAPSHKAFGQHIDHLVKPHSNGDGKIFLKYMENVEPCSKIINLEPFETAIL